MSDDMPASKDLDREQFRIACALAQEVGWVRVSLLQRGMWLTYSQAARIVDEMVERGLVGAAHPRTYERRWFGSRLLERPRSG
jgi:DNA-binding MarR family transcriptional regulator